MITTRHGLLAAITTIAIGLNAALAAPSIVSSDHYWLGDGGDMAWYPNGKNLAYTESDPHIAPALTAHSRKMDQGVFKIGENVYQTFGYALASTAFFVGPEGVLVIDPPEDVIKGRESLAAFREFSDAPIVGVMYSHFHIDHYAGVRAFVSDEDVASGKVRIIAHSTFLNDVLRSKTVGVGPIIGARVDYSLGTLLETGPDGRINSGIGPDLVARELSLIAPTDVFDDELDTEIGGLRVVFKWAPSEAPNEIVAWFPDLKVLHGAEVIQGESFPNLHTIRGTKYRDPQRWFRSIDVIRKYPAEYLVLAHGRPVAGKAAVENVLTHYRDGIQFVYDQTLRFMNRGYLPDELVEKVLLPSQLAEHPFLGDFYGGVKHSVRQIYTGELGWFNGDPTFLDPYSNKEASARYVNLMGGRNRVVKEATRATKAGDHQWSAELLTHVIRIDNDDHEARHLKAKNLREIGYGLTNTNWRNWYMTSAQELDGTLDYDSGVDLSAPDLVRAFPTGAMLEGLRFRLDGARAAADGAFIRLGVTVTDSNSDYSVILRNGVLEYEAGRLSEADIRLQMSRETLQKLTRRGQLDDEIAANTVSLLKGTASDLRTFFNYFDSQPTVPVPVTVH